LLIIIFLGSLFKPLGNNWSGNVSSFFSGNGWPLDNGSIIKMITHAGIRDQIALATDPAIIEQLQDKILYLNFARLMLVGLFCLSVRWFTLLFKKDVERAGLQYKI
jgi:hypothetical protein